MSTSPMKTLVTFLIITLVGFQSSAENVFRIEVGKDYRKYSDQDLRRRVWELERAVWQLQQRVYHLEGRPTFGHTWVCTLKAFSRVYTETGASQAVAKANVIKACSEGENGAFHCRSPKCER